MEEQQKNHPIFTEKCPWLMEQRKKCPHFNKNIEYQKNEEICPFMSNQCPYLESIKGQSHQVIEVQN